MKPIDAEAYWNVLNTQARANELHLAGLRLILCRYDWGQMPVLARLKLTNAWSKILDETPDIHP